MQGTMSAISKLFNLNDPGWGRNNKPGDNKRPGRNQDGPPDLDEVWKDFNQRLGGLFGRKRSGGQGGGGSAGGPSSRGFRVGAGVIALVAAGLWAASGFYIVQEGQVGVVTQFGKYKSTSTPGFQWRMPYPFQNHELVNVAQLRTFEVGFRGNARNKVLQESLILTDDENIVDVQFVVQYRLRGDGAPDYLFKMRDPDEAVRQASEAAMREIVGRKPMDFVLYEGRTEVAGEVQNLMQQILDRYHTGIQVSTVAIQNVQPPEQVQAAFDDAVKAGQDRERQINEGQAYANKVVPLARGTASRMIEQAEGYRAKVVGDAEGDASRFLSILDEYRKAPDVMRDRMYLDTMQSIYGNASKVLVDTKDGNNMIYLPLDKLVSSGAAAGQAENNAAQAGGAAAQSQVQGRDAAGQGGANTGAASASQAAQPYSLTRDRPVR